MALTHSFIALWMILAQASAPAAPESDLASAKTLYASGDYEDALTRLSAVRDDRSLPEAAEYRALCLLALGRTSEAQGALEDLFARNPMFKMSQTEVAPRLVAMFDEVRRRLLPAVAKEMYAKGKDSFERGQYAAASSQLQLMLGLIGEEDAAEEAPELTDLKLLGEGFRQLAERELAAAAAAAAAAKAAEEAASKAESAQASVPPVPAPPTIYSAADADVKPPVEIAREMPAWRPPNDVAARLAYRGVLRIVIDEGGAVESADLVIPVSESYDAQLLAAARQWRFGPAQRNDQPVKYEKLITITLSPTNGKD